ncbi:hypothetical protein [Campylobacter showae]|uniref:hypothetical protein n=1 Tax=Campylobacter showae TaxID=204 RepID=UPI0013D250C9|nr:hypothetical protein [Campylobacter showae]
MLNLPASTDAERVNLSRSKARLCKFDPRLLAEKRASQAQKSPNFTKSPFNLRFIGEFFDFQPIFTSNSLNCTEILKANL